MPTVWDFNTAVAELNSLQNFPAFISVVNDAFYYEGIGPLLPLLILAIIGIATYGKTQNIGATVVAVSICYLLMYPYMADQLGIIMQVIFGIVVLGAAYVLWKALFRQGG